jgi:hypothetical protein
MQTLKGTKETMSKRTLRVGLCLLLAPAAAMAFETVDTLQFPSRGVYPAYPGEAVRYPNIWAQGGVLRDNNILRLANGGSSDTVTRLGAGIRHQFRPVGRQTVTLEARADDYRYDKFSTLNHLAYGLLGEWGWELGNDLSGTLGYTRRRRLIDIGELQAAVRDLIIEQRFYATAAYRLTPDFRVRGAADQTRVERSQFTAAEVRATGAALGLDYVTPRGNALGIEVRTASGDAPVPETIAPAGALVNNDFREREVAGVATYIPNPQWRLTGRLGRTHRTYTQFAGRDFTGTTYNANLDWLPGNKTILGFSVYKQPISIIDVAASHVLVKGVSFGPSWAPTQKLVFSARLVRERRSYQGDPALQLVPGTPMRDETLRLIRLAAGWELQRNLELTGGWDIGERSSNIPGRNYDYHALMANLKWSF